MLFAIVEEILPSVINKQPKYIFDERTQFFIMKLKKTVPG